MHGRREQLRRKQRDAIWRWRWLGLRDSTPGFKGSVIALGIIAVYIAVRALTGTYVNDPSSSLHCRCGT